MATIDRVPCCIYQNSQSDIKRSYMFNNDVIYHMKLYLHISFSTPSSGACGWPIPALGSQIIVMFVDLGRSTFYRKG